MALPKLNLRQTIEGMPLTFNAEAAGNLTAVIQFDVTGVEPGVYHLSITKGECTFHHHPLRCAAENQPRGTLRSRCAHAGLVHRQRRSKPDAQNEYSIQEC